jgi:transglutaminase-like putative cysteine protease
MQIRVGYELVFDCPQRLPMILTLHIHSSRVSDISAPDYLITNPSVPIAAYRDGFGNWCSRIVAPIGEIRLTVDAVVRDTGKTYVVANWAQQQ